MYRDKYDEVAELLKEEHDTDSPNEILWWEDWNERQKYSETFSIITREELEKIM